MTATLLRNAPPARKLSAAGFGSDDISAALAWLDGLAGPEGGRCSPPALAGSIRIYGEEELDRLSTACRGFISFLEQKTKPQGSLGALEVLARRLGERRNNRRSRPTRPARR